MDHECHFPRSYNVNCSFSWSYGANSWFFEKLRGKWSSLLKLRCKMLFFVKLRGELHGEVLSTRGSQKTQKSIEISEKTITHPRPGAPLERPLATGFWRIFWSTGKSALKQWFGLFLWLAKGGYLRAVLMQVFLRVACFFTFWKAAHPRLKVNLENKLLLWEKAL